MLLNEATNELEIKVVWGDIPKEVKEQINSGAMKTKTFKIRLINRNLPDSFFFGGLY